MQAACKKCFTQTCKKILGWVIVVWSNNLTNNVYVLILCWTMLSKSRLAGGLADFTSMTICLIIELGRWNLLAFGRPIFALEPWFASGAQGVIAVLLWPDPSHDAARLRSEEARESFAMSVRIFVVFDSCILYFLVVERDRWRTARRWAVRQEPVEEPAVFGWTVRRRHTLALHRSDGQWQHLARVEGAGCRGAVACRQVAAHPVRDAPSARRRSRFVEAALHDFRRDLARLSVLLHWHHLRRIEEIMQRTWNASLQVLKVCRFLFTVIFFYVPQILRHKTLVPIKTND